MALRSTGLRASANCVTGSALWVLETGQTQIGAHASSISCWPGAQQGASARAHLAYRNLSSYEMHLTWLHHKKHCKSHMWMQEGMWLSHVKVHEKAC